MNQIVQDSILALLLQICSIHFLPANGARETAPFLVFCFHPFFCEVIYAVMSITPWKRLSEGVLADSIIAFYTEAKLVPPGMPVSSLQGWSSRMAYGTRKIVQRFRKVFAASPSLAKSATVTALKRRLLADGIQEDTSGAVHRQLSQSDLEELHAPAFDWEALTQKIMEAKLAKKKSTEEVEKQECRPVATAARSHRLPPLVLAALGQQQASPPAPVAMTGGQEDEAGTVAESTVKTRSPKKAKPAKKKKGGGKKKPKKGVVAGPEEEKNLLLVEAEITPALSVLEPAVPEASLPLQAPERGANPGKGAYEPGKFNEVRKSYIAQKRLEGLNFRGASSSWMMSNERADMISTLSPAEMKKRRFC